MSEVRLIDANALRELVTDMAGKAGTKGAYAAVWKCARLIDNAPTITPESLGYRKVVHGRWVDENPIEPHPMFRAKVCSHCGYVEGSPNNYCPSCGARMDGEP